jgi:hypothetical protein
MALNTTTAAAVYRTGYLGRGYTVHVLTLTGSDPFYRSFCRPRWNGAIMTLSNPIETAAEQTGELAFVGCERCRKAFAKVSVS